MNLATRARAAAPGFLLGALTGVVSCELILAGVLPIPMSMAIVIFGLVGAAVWAVGRPGVVTWTTAIALAAYLAVTGTPLMRYVVRSWVREDVMSAPLDAVVALSSGVSSNGSLDHHSLDRALTAAKLVKAGVAPRLITTRIRQRLAGRRIVTNDSAMREIVALAGLEDRWMMTAVARSTRDEALGVRGVLGAAAGRRIAVVTSPLHTRRACATFEAAGFIVTCVAALEHDVVARDPRTRSDRILACREYIYERAAMIKSRMNGWVH